MCTFVHFCIFLPNLPLHLKCFTMHTSFFFSSSCHYKEFAELIIGIFAFCTMTGVIALDNKESTEMLRLGLEKCSGGCLNQHLFWAFAVEL